MTESKWHLVSTMERSQTLDDFCTSIGFTRDTNENYIYRIKDGIEQGKEMKKENWYRVKEIDLNDPNDSQKFLERFKNLDSNDVSFMGVKEVYSVGRSVETVGNMYSIENFPNVIVNENGDIHVVENFQRWIIDFPDSQGYVEVTKVYQEEEWNDTNNSWDIVGGEYFLRNYSPYWLFGEKGDIFFWGSQGEGSGKMEWENVVCIILNGVGWTHISYILVLPEKNISYGMTKFPDSSFSDENIKRIHFGSYNNMRSNYFPPEEFVREFEKTKNANGEVEIECISGQMYAKANGTDAFAIFLEIVHQMRMQAPQGFPKVFGDLVL